MILKKIIKIFNPYFQIKCFFIRLYWFLRNKINIKYYSVLSTSEVKKNKKSNTLFIFGSGYSLNHITKNEWNHFEKHDTISFNWFVYQKFVHVDYHIIREISPSDLDKKIWKTKIYEYSNCIKSNPHFHNTIFLVQEGFYAINGNKMIGMKLLPQNNEIFRFKNIARGKLRNPSNDLKKGIVHASGTLSTCINLAWLIGWKKMVLVGVDLYDRKYFWLKEDETRDSDIMRGATYKHKHNMSFKSIQTMKLWKEYFNKLDVELYIYNPKSLLTEVLPVYNIK